MEKLKTDVLVVGTGPSGLTAAVALATQGIKVLAISKYPGTAPAPRAHITNQRTMEVFRDFGIEDAIREIGYDLSFLSYNVIATSLAGIEIGRYRSYGTPPDRLSEYALASPSPAINCQQHVMEPVLLSEAKKRGADVRFNNELLSIQQTPDEIIALVLDRETGKEYEVRAPYAIGADGGRSTVAQQLDFKFVGEAGLKGMASSWIEADVTKYTAYRPGILYWMSLPGYPRGTGTASWTCVKPFTEWLLVHPWEGGNGEKPSEGEVMERARLTLGDQNIPIHVKHISTWQVNNVVATEYQKGRVFLAGDAAHRHPPYGGLGTNTSIQDAFGLAWKLAFVLKGQAGTALLSSHTEERQPVGAHVVHRAIESFKNMGPLMDALGLKDSQTEDEGLAVLQELFCGNSRGTARRDRLTAAIKLQDYRSNALGVDLGQRYTSKAIISENVPFPEPDGDPELHYRPTTHSGACIPHAWVEHERKQLSTLDLAGHGRFCLIIGAGGEPWVQAARQASTDLGIELPVFSVGLRCEYDDVTCDWAKVREVGDGGAILVRPDRFIAWRAMDLPESPIEVLGAALRQVLSIRR
ncbi:MAG TPA: FAD-dependent monooxygenase [Paraburkholderia sp.]|uniref:FAD-dependent monooxygenase n=1 Tax=Paraburkholderia sp. TaxID=1926495 RepID=UPI002B475F9D|nr:FAD-dependent monooxygenase [Paraburkholderia sp.]HKR42495.1 FAD-dependent monooxygenase [Paraburkholderia sp.]